MEQKIALYMKNLGITREEALQLIADDEADVSVEITPEQAKVAKEMAQADRKKETAPRKRERKPDNDKRHLIRLLEIAIGYNPDVTDFVTTNPEREIEFNFRGVHYKMVLSKPRGEK